jgi:hypothetical protein
VTLLLSVLARLTARLVGRRRCGSGVGAARLGGGAVAVAVITGGLVVLFAVSPRFFATLSRWLSSPSHLP